MECTEAGRSLMQNRAAGGLSTKERQVILLVTGSPASRKMFQSMGEEGRQIVRSLAQRGVLRPSTVPRGASSAGRSASTFASTGFADSGFDTRFGSRAARPEMRMPQFADSQMDDSRFLPSQLLDKWQESPSSFGDSRFAQSGFGAKPPVMPQPGMAATASAASPASRPVAAAAPPAPPALPVAAPVAAPKPAAPARSSKRSLAASKMYMIDMLQLLRCMDASALAVDIQTSQTETELVDNMLRGAAFFATTTNASYAGKVYAKLQDILPEEHLDRLQPAAV